MNREIKFRAWNIVTKTMIDLKKITPFALSMDTDGLFIPFSDGLPLMQFTGLKDKSGKDIYEDDIVGTHCFNKDQRHFVEWTREGWKAGGYHLDSIYYEGSSSFKVIGNIWENPELLNLPI